LVDATINNSMTRNELEQLSKDALEELGRTKGVELDKRFNKAKLVGTIAKLFKAETKPSTSGPSFRMVASDENSG
jgi:hypothetical protein